MDRSGSGSEMPSNASLPRRRGCGSGTRPRLRRKTYSMYSAPTWPVSITSATALATAAPPEQFDEQRESDDFLVDGAGPCGEELEVGPALFGPVGESRRERAGGGARLLLEQRLLARRMLDVLPDAPGARVQRDLLGSEKDGDAIVVGADDGMAGFVATRPVDGTQWCQPPLFILGAMGRPRSEADCRWSTR
jgi:hypothetical protein